MKLVEWATYDWVNPLDFTCKYCKTIFEIYCGVDVYYRKKSNEYITNTYCLDCYNNNKLKIIEKNVNENIFSIIKEYIHQKEYFCFEIDNKYIISISGNSPYRMWNIKPEPINLLERIKQYILNIVN